LKNVSVVISTYTRKRLHDVQQCISSLKDQTFQPMEIILVLDPIGDLVSFYRSHIPEFVKIVVSEHVGLSSARNVGAAIAMGEIVAFIDDDAIAREDWLESLVNNYHESDVVGVGGLTKAVWEDTRPFWFPEELDWIVGCSYEGQPTLKSTIRNPIGCNMSFRQSVFSKVGYFRLDIGRLGATPLGDEETEFSIRVLNGIPNSKIIYEPSAVVFHKVSKNRARLKYLWSRSYHEGISKAVISKDSFRSEALSTEGVYLKYLISVGIPRRLKKIYKLENVGKLFALLLSTFGVFAGFVVGRIAGRR
jgi:glucosyl-dolichyl phosphate glucuronosyltransferase